MSPDFSDIAIRNLALNTPDMTLRGQADVNEDLVVTTSNIVADVRDLAIFAPILGLDLRGQGQVALPGLTWSEARGRRCRGVCGAPSAPFAKSAVISES